MPTSPWVKTINYAQIVRGVLKFGGAPPIPDPAAAVRERFERRVDDFIETVRRVVFENPGNPYHALFRLAGCTFGDFAQSVRRDGLEPTLSALQRGGVYLTHEEFKGRRPIVRGSLEIQARPDRFVNPSVRALLETTSSGSTGPPSRTPKGLERTLYTEACQRLVYQEYGLHRAAYVELRTILPGTTGLNHVLRRERMGFAPGAWLCAGRSLRRDGDYRLATYALLLMLRTKGLRPPFPRLLADGDFLTPARWVAARRREGRACLISGMTSAVTRVAAAALEHGLDIRGSVAQTGGEPITEAKHALFRRAGLLPLNGYWTNEVGLIGLSCPAMAADGDAVHHFSEATAVVPRHGSVPGWPVPVDSLLFTTLLPFSPLLLINVEVGDTAVIEPARCGCPLARLGLATQLRGIHSVGKLTGQGMTVLGADIVAILEAALPARLGGAPGDFQLVEHEGRDQTELLLLVSPRVPIPGTEAVREAFFEELRRRDGGLQAERIWRQSQTLRVIVAEPTGTASGKVPPLRRLVSARSLTHAS
ncbi:MAG TPA: hypothetical protein VNK41_06955 [Vicinamibacterales bacterium]|nr:hypothetical protein [Vicinamibacterales bacterium]